MWMIRLGTDEQGRSVWLGEDGFPTVLRDRADRTEEERVAWWRLIHFTAYHAPLRDAKVWPPAWTWVPEVRADPDAYTAV